MTKKADRKVRLDLIERCNKLETENQDLKKDFYCMVGVAEDFIRIAHPYTYQEARDLSSKKGYFPFIPHSLSSVLRLLKEAEKVSREAQGKSYSSLFLDAGCGVGNIMRLAQAMGYIAHGVERCRKNVKIARRAVSARVETGRGFANITKVFCGDLFNFKHYGKYDVIYYFCPMSKHDIEVEFEHLVEDGMKVGAVLAACSKSDGKIRDDKRFRYVRNESGGGLFLKVSK